MHTCPECGLWCHCGGDIDDLDLGDVGKQANCTCCPSDEEDEPDEPEEIPYDRPQFDNANRLVEPRDRDEEDRGNCDSLTAM